MRGRTLALAAGVVLVLLAAAPAAAQTGSNDSTAENATQVQDRLGSLVIHSYSYDDDDQQMTISATWRGEFPTTATLTEMIELDSSGSTDISFKQIRLRPGERTEIKVGARERSGGTAAVLISTPESVRNSSALVLQSGSPSSSDPVPFNITAALILVTATGGAGAAFGFVRRKRDGDDDDWYKRVG